MDIINDLLPVGSVILTRDADKRLMIAGVKPMDLESGEEYDYIAVLYPEGYIGDEARYYVNHEDIETVVYLGYSDEERDEFLAKLSQVYKWKDSYE